MEMDKIGISEQREAPKLPTRWYASRVRAAVRDPRLRARRYAADQLCIDEKTLYRIEVGERAPQPDEVFQMARVYGMPELKSEYCSRCCSLGRDRCAAEDSNIDRISIKAYVRMQRIEASSEELMQIVEDGVVSDGEMPQFRRILSRMMAVEQSFVELQAWIDRQGR